MVSRIHFRRTSNVCVPLAWCSVSAVSASLCAASRCSLASAARLRARSSLTSRHLVFIAPAGIQNSSIVGHVGSGFSRTCTGPPEGGPHTGPPEGGPYISHEDPMVPAWGLRVGRRLADLRDRE